MSYDTERTYLAKISPKSLSGNTSESGLSADQIKEKFYAGLFYLHDLLEDVRTAYAAADSTLTSSISTLETSLTSLTTRVTTLESEISEAAVSELWDDVEALQTLTATHTSNISTLESSISTVSASVTALQSAIVNGTISAYKAIRDGNGNIITSTYATATSLATTNAEITKIKNGTTVVSKATSDQDGNVFENTYVKIEDIVNNVTSTSTTAPLSAYQGKVLKDTIDTISDYIYYSESDDSINRLQEVFTFLANNSDDETLTSVLAEKMSFTDLVTNYTSDLDDYPLAASVAVALKALIDEKVDVDDVIYEPQLTFTAVSIDED